MPAKNLCPDCGMKTRGVNHLCDPTKVEKTQRLRRGLEKLQK